MQFKVPQFLEIEDKIFGPFTFRQFVYLTGGAGICFVLYKLLGLKLAALPIIAIGGFTGALTFYRPNNKPFIYMLEAGAKYLSQSKLYIWKKGGEDMDSGGRQTQNKNQDVGTQMVHQDPSKLSGSKLRDLAWSLDVLDLSKKESEN